MQHAKKSTSRCASTARAKQQQEASGAPFPLRATATVRPTARAHDRSETTRRPRGSGASSTQGRRHSPKRVQRSGPISPRAAHRKPHVPDSCACIAHPRPQNARRVVGRTSRWVAGCVWRRRRIRSDGRRVGRGVCSSPLPAALALVTRRRWCDRPRRLRAAGAGAA